MTSNRTLITGLFLITQLLSLPISSAETKEAPPIKNETEKLKAIRKILRERRFFPALPPEPAYCAQFMRDLVRGRNIQAVEPDVRAASEEDPGLKKWHQCDNATVFDMETTDPKSGFDRLSLIGEPPYRYYRIELDGVASNGKEDLIYHEATAGHVGPAGYTSVDLKGCFIKWEVPTPWQTMTPSNFQPLNLIARYKSEYIVLDMIPNTTDPKIPNYDLTITRLNRAHRPLICGWHERVSKPITAPIHRKTPN